MSAILDAVEKKKSGGELSEAEIVAVVRGYTRGEIPDYQMAALLMAVFIRGMTFDETFALTRAMADSGKRYSFPECADKHSTGGVGDKVSLTALPVAAACGVPVAKLSGRGLGATGGTVDKLEAIPGFSATFSEDRFRRQVEEVGLAIAEAGDLAPADRKIYALRDATATVDSLPLIGSSIVSKKAATGSGNLLYDVKCGSGAFVKTLQEARNLADLLVSLSAALGVRASTFITGMDEPLGKAVGNALEVRESLAFLKGESVPEDLALMARRVAAQLLKLKDIPKPEAAVEKVLSSGAAYETFERFVCAQGGDASALDRLPVSREVRKVQVKKSGYVARFDAGRVGRAALVLGAGRHRKGDALDFGAGVEVLVRVGERVQSGWNVALLYGSRGVEEAVRLVEDALQISDEPVERDPAILGSL